MLEKINKINLKNMEKLQYDVIPGAEMVLRTEEALKANGFLAETVATGAEALEKVKEIIVKDSSVMNGSSRTLDEMGFVDYLKKGGHGWNNLHEGILKETDPAKQVILRKQSALSDFYLGSVHAVTEVGELIIASNSGSQLPHIVFTSPNVIFVVGTQKIVPNFAEAITRLEDYVFPLEDKRIMGLYGSHSMISKVVTLRRENPMMGRKVHVILVNEKLGY